MAKAQHTVVGFEIARDQIHGLQGGFMGVRRLNLCNVRDDGSRSAPFVCDFIVRPKGVDAVVVALWHRRPDGQIEVLLRDALRPALSEGRRDVPLAIPDDARPLLLTEVVAGIIEREDEGEAGVRQRAAIEVDEEAGYTIAPDDVEFLGAGTFPSPGSMPEKFWLLAAEVADPTTQRALEGDGSPMEEGARTRWMPLRAAIEACVAGDIEDCKTELVLRRLADRLQ